jgi:hypothetical protein
MLITLTKKLIDFGFIKISSKRLSRWRKKGYFELMQHALEKGSYDIKIIAIQEFGKIKSIYAYDILLEAINDEIRPVSLKAIESLKIIGLKPEHTSIIEEKIDYWQNIVIEEQINLSKRKFNQQSDVHWERKSKETLENVKQMLKKPMNTGKWF